MSTNQPVWKLIAQLGDVDPVTYGGYFIYVDETGVYDPEGEVLISPDDDDESAGWTVYRFSLDHCTYIDGVLSDNKFHPEMDAWFAPCEAKRQKRPQDSHLAQVAAFIGADVDDLHTWLCSEDPVQRAEAYRAIGEYHGYENLDQYPLTFHTREEVEQRYVKVELQ